MAKTRTIYLQLDKVLEEVFVLGTELVMDIYHVAPPGAESFSVSASVDVTCWVSTPFRSAANDARGRVAVGTQVHAQVLTPSQEVGDKKMSVTFYGEKADVALAKARVYLTAIGEMWSLSVVTSALCPCASDNERDTFKKIKIQDLRNAKI
ncbi:protein-arginine deiminase type-2-like [Petromyzon marinus]|uniref:protein-arginine deiminase type-2-like n=1 Tax=Petromyzon marinus TaxID=7757 RepID=UPI003F716CF9